MRDNEVCLHDDPEEYARWEADEHPVGRIGKPEEVAFVALMIASDESDFMTGACVALDGGLTAK
jgi:NAD(P)-dependent dehydrogenase (short-subunit alcohol dehydrogenase family)